MEIDSVDVEVSEKRNHFNEKDKSVVFALIDSITEKRLEIKDDVKKIDIENNLPDAVISVDSENNLPCVSTDETIVEERNYEQFQYLLDQYQEQPYLLDSCLESIVEKLIAIIKSQPLNSRQFHQAFRFLYHIGKVRNFKYVSRYLPHEVSDFEPVLNWLESQQLSDRETWQTRYCLLRWVAILCKIPFDLSRYDVESKRSLKSRIVDATKPYLLQVDNTCDAAAITLATFLSRPDCSKTQLPYELSAIVQNLGVFASAKDLSLPQMFHLIGILRTLAEIFKQGRRDDLLLIAPKVLQAILGCKFPSVKNTLLRKMATKVIQRIALVFLPPRIATWRYSRGARSLMVNLGASTGSAVKQGSLKRSSAGGGDADLSSTAMSEQFNSISEEILSEVESVLDYLLNALKDRDTVVRWSAAKGIGRVTSRLPRQLADDIISSILGLFNFSENDGAWHGGCLALAELGRRGLLLPSRLHEVVPVVVRALNYDEVKGNYSIGAHVRDSACYVCWAFARAYDPIELQPYVEEIANALLIVAVFDREVNCRRAASAAFQENVGRQGQFPHGIEIVTMVDYFSVGNRTFCYTDLAIKLAKFSEYAKHLIDHVSNVKISHWDEEIRKCAAEALKQFVLLNPSYVLETILPALVDLTSSND